LISINKKTINSKLKSFDNNLDIIKEVTEKLAAIDKIDFDANKPERYKKFIQLITKT